MRIAIIGAGFSGCQLAIELLRSGSSPIDILLLDWSATFGPGVAYGARHDRLLLNTRVANMSALATDPSHFLRWLWAKDLPAHPAASIPPSGHAFVARAVYGRYLAELLDQAEAAAPGDVALIRIGHRVVGLTEQTGDLQLQLGDGSARTADVAVLAIGNLPPPAAAFRPRGMDLETRIVGDWLVNCAGPTPTSGASMIRWSETS